MKIKEIIGNYLSPKKFMDNIHECRGMFTFAFNVITVGSLISCMGNQLVFFAMSLLVYDESESILFYSIYLAIYQASQIAFPLLFGPFLDRMKRKTVIYLMDFISAGMYFGIGFLLHFDMLTYPVLLLSAVILGMVDSAYSAAFSSIYPNLVEEKYLKKAYSISSMIDTLEPLMVPAAAVLYKFIGLEITFFASAVLFLAAAIMETMPKIIESQTERTDEGGIKGYVKDISEGIKYVVKTPFLVLMLIMSFFGSVFGGASEAILLPFFEMTWEDGYFIYILFFAFGISGNFQGGLFGFISNIPKNARYYVIIGITLYSLIFDAAILFMPLIMMLIFEYISGVVGVVSGNISAASYNHMLDNNYRGRVSGVLTMIGSIGGLLGTLLAGIASEIFIPEFVYYIFAVVSSGVSLACYFFGKKTMKNMLESYSGIGDE